MCTHVAIKTCNDLLCSVVSTGGVGVSDHTPWPLRNSKVFHSLNAVMERYNDLTELVHTMHDFRYTHYMLTTCILSNMYFTWDDIVL